MKKILAQTGNILTSAEKRRFTTLIFLNTLLSIADIGSIALVFVVLNIYSGQNTAWLDPVLRKLNIQHQSLLPAIILIIIFVAKSGAGYAISKGQFRYISNIASRLTEQNLQLYLEGSYEDHVNVDSAVWLRRICFQPLEFAQYVLSGVQQVINELILIIISVTALALYNIKLLVIVSLVLLPAIFILTYITKKKLKETRKNIQTANELSLQYLNEAISGFVESNIYEKNAFFIDRYAQSRFTVNRFIADMLVTQAIPNRFFETFAVIGLFILIAAISFGAGENNMSILMLGAFVAAAYKIIPGISRIINFSGQIKTYLFTINELVKEKKPGRLAKFLPFNGNIQKMELRHVKFSYGNNPVFNDLSCIIEKNSFTGVSGNSGKGKTTMIDLFLGFLSPRAGSVLFNENVMSPDEIKKCWPQMAYVKQTTFLLHDSILHNITLYKEDIDEKKLAEIISVSGLTTWISQLPDGIHTIITENGKNISGGQRQRIAIARALFKDAPIVILDEPFNELDETSEMELLNYFKQLSRAGKIVLLVTHHSGSLSFCDNIIFLNEQAT